MAVDVEMVVTAAGVGLLHIALHIARENIAEERVAAIALERPRVVLSRSEVDTLKLIDPFLFEERVFELRLAVLAAKEEPKGVFRVTTAAAEAAPNPDARIDLESGAAIGIDQVATSPEHLAIREAMMDEVESLAREIEFSLTAAQVQERELWPELVILSGGGSLIEGLAAALEKALGVDVRCLNDLEELALLGQFGDQFTAAPLFSVAAGLALKGTSRRAGFNFQAEEVGSQNPLVKWRQQLSYALVACALVAFAWLGSVGMDVYTKKRRLTNLNQSVEAVFRRTVPEFKGSVQSSQYASIVKTKINELGQSVALFGEEGGYHSAVELLRVISKAIPADLNVTISLLTVDNQRVRLSGQADAFNTVDGVKNRLTALDNFDKVAITGAKAAKDGKGVQFGLELNRHQLTGEGS